MVLVGFGFGVVWAAILRLCWPWHGWGGRGLDFCVKKNGEEREKS